MTLNNETRHIKWHETYKCICRLDKIICNSKQRRNKDKCRCKCKELIDNGVCDKRYIVCIVFSIILAICIEVGIYFVYYRCYLKKYGTRKETLIY